MAEGITTSRPLPRLYDPLQPPSEIDVREASKQALREARKANKESGATAVAGLQAKASVSSAGHSTGLAILKSDFRNFLVIVWRFLKLPDPTPIQLSMARWLQTGPDRGILMGFRGVAKSWITAAYALWCLYCNPQAKILVVSASLSRATQFVQFCLMLIREMPELEFLRPRPEQRQSGQQFDVGPARPDQSPSLRAAGITGQITGSRADVIVPDDVEIPSNSMTVLMREKIREAVKEFDSILKPGGKIKFLGTPQTEDSLYAYLRKRGYKDIIYPALFPTKKQQLKYGDSLAPWVIRRLQANINLVGHSTEPERFTDEDLSSRRLSLGNSTFALQFMLDTSLSDAEKYPLKLHDLIVMGLDFKNGPDMLSWGNDEKLVKKDLPLLGFEGDRFYGPANVGERFSPYNAIVGWVDPSGRGTDETTLNVIAELHGRLFLLHCSGWRDGFGDDTLKAIADVCIKLRVQRLYVEDNFGDGMFLSLLEPVLVKAWKEFNKDKPEGAQGGTLVEGVKSPKVQKELRILSSLEPVTQGHRLVVSTAVIEQDYQSIQKIDSEETRDRYSLFYQLTHLTRDRDCLMKDDRIEGLAAACAQFADVIGVNPWEMAGRRDEDRMAEELEKLFEDADDVSGSPKEPWRRYKQSIRPD